MKYKIEETGNIYDSIDEVIEDCMDEDWHLDDDYFAEWVDDNYDRVTINGETYYPYQILECCDEDNLNDLHRQYCQSCNEEDADEAHRELERADIGDRIEVQGYVVVVMDDDEDDTDDDETLMAIEELRTKLQNDIAAAEVIKKEEKKNEDDLIKMFQIVGG